MADFQHPPLGRPVIGFPLLSAPASIDDVEAALVAEYGDAVSRHDSDDPAHPHLLMVAQGEVAVVVSPVASPVPGGEARRGVHPVWWSDDAEVAAHAAHLVVTAVRGEEPPTREELLGELALTSAVAALMCELPNAIGFYFASAGITFPAAPYASYVRSTLEAGELPIDVWTSVWVLQDETGALHALTLGLPVVGHADVEIEGSGRSASDLFMLLKNLANFLVATGEALQPGVLQYEDADLPVSVSADGTALRIAF